MRGPASLSAPATLACVRVLSEFVLAGARSAGFPVETLPRYDLALEEALINVVRYAYPPDCPGEVEVAYEFEPDGSLEVRICDGGRPFDPLQLPDPDLSLGIADRPQGGLGIFLIKQIASVTYSRTCDRNVLSLRFERPACATAQP